MTEVLSRPPHGSDFFLCRFHCHLASVQHFKLSLQQQLQLLTPLAPFSFCSTCPNVDRSSLFASKTALSRSLNMWTEPLAHGPSSAQLSAHSWAASSIPLISPAFLCKPSAPLLSALITSHHVLPKQLPKYLLHLKTLLDYHCPHELYPSLSLTPK